MITIEKMRELFLQLKADEHSTILILTDVFNLFRYPDISMIKLTLDVIHETIQEEAAISKLIFLPSFTYSFCSTGVYDIKLSKPETGALPNSSIQKSHFTRTHSPLNSYLYTGNSIEHFPIKATKTTFGSESLTGWLTNQQTLIISIGIPLDQQMGWIVAHHAEEKARVPYRHFKSFSGSMFEDGKFIETCKQEHFVRSNLKLGNDFSSLNETLLQNNKVNIPKNTSFKAFSATAANIVDVADNILEKDVYGLTEQKSSF